MTILTDLKRAGIMGINARNLDYVLRCNPRKFYPLVDDKLKTKELAIKAGIRVPEMFGVLRSQHDVRDLTLIDRLLQEHGPCVFKPTKGSGGGGIIILVKKTPQGYRKANGLVMQGPELTHHLNNMLSGMFSLGGHSDQVLIEYMVVPHPGFAQISYEGVPDIRVIVYQGVPVMAMLRLPTRASDGKANLHRGGIGVGVDMATGTTLKAVQGRSIISHHPDTGAPISGFHIPDWNILLEMASRFYEITGMGYIGVDMVLDKDKGPMLLEVNARPGLAIQLANQQGLLPRLRAVDAGKLEGSTSAEKVAFAEDRFAADLTKSLTAMTELAA